MIKKNTIKNENGELVIYTGPKGAVEFRADTDKETIWATQKQIVSLFEINQSVVSRHIKNILKDWEVDEKSNMQKMHNANSDKPKYLYSLDIILAVGYREKILFIQRTIKNRELNQSETDSLLSVIHDYANSWKFLKEYLKQFIKLLTEMSSTQVLMKKLHICCTLL